MFKEEKDKVIQTDDSRPNVPLRRLFELNSVIIITLLCAFDCVYHYNSSFLVTIAKCCIIQTSIEMIKYHSNKEQTLPESLQYGKDRKT